MTSGHDSQNPASSGLAMMREEAKGKQKLVSLRKYNTAVKSAGRKNYFLLSQMKL